MKLKEKLKARELRKKGWRLGFLRKMNIKIEEDALPS